ERNRMEEMIFSNANLTREQQDKFAAVADQVTEAKLAGVGKNRMSSGFAGVSQLGNEVQKALMPDKQLQLTKEQRDLLKKMLTELGAIKSNTQDVGTYTD